MTENNEMELIGTALQNFDRVSAGLALLEKNYKGMLYDVESPMGMEHAKAARAAIREPRYEVERVRKSAKAPILALGKRLEAEATRITNALLTLETPIDEQIKSEEDRKKQEKLAKAAAEAKRIQEIQARIEGIRAWPVKAAGKPSSLVQQMTQTATDYRLEGFEEFTDTAAGALDSSRAALAGILAERLSHEAEQERIKAERVELDNLRAAQAERTRIEAAEQAKAAAAAKALHDAEARAQAETLRLEREENARVAAVRKAELDRQAAEQREAHDAEAARIAADRAELERQQAELRKASEPKPKSRKPVQNPGRAAIVQVLADHYAVDDAVPRRWLKEIDWEQEVA